MEQSVRRGRISPSYLIIGRMGDMRNTDTIAAVATAMSSSGIGIIGVSGDEAFSIGDQIFRKYRSDDEESHLWNPGQESHKVFYGHICDRGEIVDEVMVLVMKGPHSYTAEDTIEIQCHGGILVMKKILETVIRYGARPAEPGEFTKRAFLNGRMDLSQAEAVMDVINARNQYALKSSVSQLNGKVSGKIRELRAKILYEIAFIESALDDPEHISLDGYPDRLRQILKPVIEETEKLLDSADNGRVMKEGIRTVILGKPNAGKSSLMNVLLGEERAIVTDIAGTTRDILEEQIQLEGISLNVVDTAGIRNTSDVVEQIGVTRAKNAAESADLIIYVVDSSVPLDDNDRHIMEMIKGQKAVILLNKTDLPAVVGAEDLIKLTEYPIIGISAKEGTGIDELEDQVKSMFYEGEIDFNDQIYITSVRHKTALTESCRSLKMVMESIDSGMPEDFYSIDLMDAYEQLGTIIGEAVEEDLINEIFGRFCTGK